MTQILNVFGRTLAILASQFRDQKPDGGLTNLQKLIKILCEPAQELQDVLWQLKTERWLSTSIGQQLDELGIILGLPRNPGESDEDYRERLKFQIFINFSSGTPEEIIQAALFLTDSTYVRFFDVFPAFFQLEINGTNFPDPWNELNEAIFKISPAGVNYAPITATLGNEIPFVTSGDLIVQPLAVVLDESEPTVTYPLLVEPYNAILYLSAGNVEDLELFGGLDELDVPSPFAGVISELIQINGNFPPVR